MSSEMRMHDDEGRCLCGCTENCAVAAELRGEITRLRAVVNRMVEEDNERFASEALLARTEAGAVAQCDRPGCCCPTLLRNECAKRWTREELKSPQGLDDDCLDDRAWAKAIEDALGLACGLAVIEGDAYDWIMAKANELCPHAAPAADGAVAWIHESDLTHLKNNPDDFQAAMGNQATPRHVPLYTHPQDAGGDAAPVLFGRDSGGDWYVDTDTKSICVDVDFDPARQLSLVLKQDGSVAWSIFVQEPDSSTTKATGPSVMNPGFYEALSYIAMQAKEAK